MTAGEDDTSLDRIASALGAVADAIHHLAENVDEYRKTSEANAESVATSILRIAHGDGLTGPTGLEGLTMAINGVGEPGGNALTDAIASGFCGVADAIRDGQQAGAA